MSIAASARRMAARIDPRWLAWLVAIDVAFVMLHIAPNVLGDERFSMLEDGGYAEWFRYLQSFVIAMLAAGVARRRRDGFFAVVAMLFLYVLLDDALRLHESAGIWLTDNVALFAAAGELGHALGELAYLCLPGGLALIALVASSRRGNDLHGEIAVLVGLLAAVGIGLDFLHSVGGIFRWPGLGLLEGGGELLAFSVATAYFVALPRADQAAEK